MTKLNKLEKSNEIGDLAELRALEAFRKYGYVANSYGGSTPFDFIFVSYKTMKPYKVQVKHAKRYQENEDLEKAIVRLVPSVGGKYNKNQVDLFCAVNNDTGKLWLIPFTETFGATKMTLGIGTAYGNKSSNFEFKNRIDKL